MWRNQVIEIRKIKAPTMSNKTLSELSGVSVDTIGRIFNISIPIKEGPGVETLVAICNALGVEVWELFYTGDKSFVGIQVEYNNLKEAHDALFAENAVLQSEVDRLRIKVDTLKDEIISTHNSYHKLIANLTK